MLISKIFAGGAALMLVLIAREDAVTLRIPDRKIAALAAWILAGHAAHICAPSEGSVWPVSLGAGMANALLTAAILTTANLLILHFGGSLFLGGGDIKLLCCGAFALGFGRSAVAFCLASLCAGACITVRGAAHLVTGKAAGSAWPEHLIAFGPFLTVGLCAAYLWADEILKWYLAG